jgi:hypothetical protein
MAVEIGDWPFCPHESVFEQTAQRFDPIVVWQSNTDSQRYSFPGRSNEPVPEGYHAVAITNMREADQLVRRVNDIERQKMEETRALRHTLDDAGIADRRREEDARGWAMRADGSKFYIRGNSRAEALQRAAREWADRRREQRRSKASIDPHFHIQVLSFNSGNRNSYSGPETGWRERKK